MNVEEIIKSSKPIAPRARIGLLIHLIHTNIQETLLKAIKPYDISLAQFNVLRILQGYRDTAYMETLNERMIHKSSNTTRVVDKLIAKGLVERKVCSQNRRKIEVRITPDGTALLTLLSEAIQKAEELLTHSLSLDELAQLTQLLNKFKTKTT
jgi:DNA-binding MarR family transcriptional regulator